MSLIGGDCALAELVEGCGLGNRLYTAEVISSLFETVMWRRIFETNSHLPTE